jgi:hypothetical protein
MRLCRSVVLLLFVALTTGSGCAAWRARQANLDLPPANGGAYPDTGPPEGGLSNLSLHDWNWNNKPGRW